MYWAIRLMLFVTSARASSSSPRDLTWPVWMTSPGACGAAVVTLLRTMSNTEAV
ncbi:hypothetical protein D9M68_969340 [compost metagenome]